MKYLYFPSKLQTLCNFLILFTVSIFQIHAENATVDTCRSPEVKSRNMFEDYWYVYDDNPKSVDYAGLWKDSVGLGWVFLSDSLAGGNSKVTNFKKKNVKDYEEFFMTAGGNQQGTSAYCAKIAWRFGDTIPHWSPKVTDVYGCYVGMGTGLISEGNVLNFKEATRISYWAKTSDTITCNFLVLTDQGSFKEFGSYYNIEHRLTPEWKQYTVELRQKDPLNPADSMCLYQPKWAIDDSAKEILPWETQQYAILPFDKSRATSLEWSLEGAGEDGHVNKAWHMKAGTLWVDDIVIENYTWYPEDACMECDTVAGIGATLPFKLVNPILLTDGGWFNALSYGAWYAYNDAKDRDVLEPFTEYSWIDTAMADYIAPDSTIPQLKLLDDQGLTGVAGDTAAYVSYVLGPAFKKVSSVDPADTNEVKPFVGIGLSLVDEDDSTQVYNADSAHLQGIYFDYKTTGAVAWLHVSFITRQKFLEEGAGFYVKIPPTDDIWRGAIVPFENIDLPPWDDKDTIAFDPTQLIAFQFSVEGDSADAGSFAIDNVYLLDTANVGVKYLTKPMTNLSGFSLKQINNRLVYTLPSGTKNAIVQLYNLQGRRLYSQRIKTLHNAGSYSLPMRTNMIANGVYVFRIKTLGDTKKVFNKAITIVK